MLPLTVGNRLLIVTGTATPKAWLGTREHIDALVASVCGEPILGLIELEFEAIRRTDGGKGALAPSIALQALGAGVGESLITNCHVKRHHASLSRPVPERPHVARSLGDNRQSGPSAGLRCEPESRQMAWFTFSSGWRAHTGLLAPLELRHAPTNTAIDSDPHQ